MFSFVKKISIRIFVGKKKIVGKKIVGKKIRHWQKNSSFFADFFSSDKLYVMMCRTFKL